MLQKLPEFDTSQRPNTCHGGTIVSHHTNRRGRPDFAATQIDVPDMNNNEPNNFKCPSLKCMAQYSAARRTEASKTKPKCEECGTPFLEMDEGYYIHYEPVFPVAPLAPRA